MPSVNSIVIDEIKRTLPDYADKLYGFDLSRLNVAIERVETLSGPTRTEMTPIAIDRGETSNCTQADQTLVLPSREREVSTSATLTLGASLSWERAVNFELGLPEGLTVGASSTLAGSITTETSFSRSTTDRVTFPGQTINVPSCSMVTSEVLLHSAEWTATYRFHVLITGKVSYYTSIDWWFDVWVDSNHYQRTTVDATFRGIGGYVVRAASHQRAAQCEPGSHCNPTRTLKAIIREGRRQLMGPGIGSDLRTDVKLSGGPAGAAVGQAFSYTPGESGRITANVTITEKDTKPDFDDVGTGLATFELPQQPGTTKIPVVVPVHTKGGDEVKYTTFVQHLEVTVTE